MSLIVMKFGGTSVADLTRIENVADKVMGEVRLGNKVAVVVSAMSGVTNQLVQYCENISLLHDAREYDSIVSSGEQVTSGLLALALQKRGVSARSWLGWQIPLKTDAVHAKARILDIETENLNTSLDNDEVAVIAGFQGVDEYNRIATLGRGGSDTSAVAFAAALKADRCDIYTDVDGVYTTDPRITDKAKKIDKVCFEEMLEMASVGAKVLQTRSVELAMKENVVIQVLSSFGEHIGSDLKGTLVVSEDEIMEQELVSAVTSSKDDSKITLRNLPDVPGIAGQIFGALSDAFINVDMIVQNVSATSKVTDLTFTAPKSDLAGALSVLEKLEILKDTVVDSSDNVVKVSVIGIGMKSQSGVAQKMFKVLASKGINIEVISTSEIKISVLIKQEYAELAVRALHTAYGLDKE